MKNSTKILAILMALLLGLTGFTSLVSCVKTLPSDTPSRLYTSKIKCPKSTPKGVLFGHLSAYAQR